MAGLDTTIRVPGIQYGGLNESIGLLQNAISSEQTNRNRRLDEGLGAAKELRVLAGQKVTRDILANTKKNTVAEDFTAEFNRKYDAIYDDTSSVRPGMEAKAKEWESGVYSNTMSPLKSDVLAKRLNSVEDASAYSNSVYDQMINAGLTTAEAEAQRKVQLAKHKAPEMSKAALQAQEIKAKAIAEGKKQAHERNKSAYQRTKAGTNTGGNRKTTAADRKEYAKNKTQNNGKFIIDEKRAEVMVSALGMQENDPMLPFFKGKTAFAGEYQYLKDQNLSHNQIMSVLNGVMTDTANMGSDKTFSGTDASLRKAIDEEQIKQNINPALANKNGSGGNGSNGNSVSSYFSETGIFDPEAYQAAGDLIDKDYDSQLSTLMNTGSASNRQVLKSISDDVDKALNGASILEDNPDGEKKKILKEGNSNQSNRIEFGSNTGVLGEKMNSPKPGLVAGYAKTNPVEFAKDYKNLSAEQKKVVDKLVKSNQNTNTILDDKKTETSIIDNPNIIERSVQIEQEKTLLDSILDPNKSTFKTQSYKTDKTKPFKKNQSPLLADFLDIKKQDQELNYQKDMRRGWDSGVNEPNIPLTDAQTADRDERAFKRRQKYQPSTILGPDNANKSNILDVNQTEKPQLLPKAPGESTADYLNTMMQSNTSDVSIAEYMQQTMFPDMQLKEIIRLVKNQRGQILK